MSTDHTAGSTNATITLDGPLTLADVGVCSVSAAPDSVRDSYGNYAGTELIPLSLSDECPDGGAGGEVYFNLNEAAGTTNAFDDEYKLAGTVGNPAVSFPGTGYFQGDEGQATYINFLNNDYCLQEGETITLETRVFTDVIDLDYFTA